MAMTCQPSVLGVERVGGRKWRSFSLLTGNSVGHHPAVSCLGGACCPSCQPLSTTEGSTTLSATMILGNNSGPVEE